MSAIVRPTVATIAKAGRLMRWIAAGFALSIGLAACSDNTSSDAVTPAPSVAALIGPAGGTVTGPDGVQVLVPAGALIQPTTLTVTRSSVGAPLAPADNPAAGPIYEFLPHGLVFNKPVTIRMPLTGNAPGNAAFMASPGEDWQVNDAVVTGGIAEWQRNSFSFGMLPGICSPSNSAPYSASQPDPYPCVYPRGASTVTATPTTVITQQSYGNPFGSAGSWVVNEAGTVQLKLTYQAAPDCQNPRVKLIRWNPAVPLSTPNRVTTVYDQPVALTVQPVILQAGVFATGSGTSSRGVGSTTVPVAFSHLDNGTNAFGFSFSCNRPFRNVMTGGDLLTFISAIPVPPSTFTVGGTVSGLTGTGLVLQNNNSGDLAIAANGAFTFATPLAAGAAYSVTVKTQPTGPTQTCTVGNGAGTATSAVTSVTVTCSVNTSSVGGTVSGLTGTGLVLQNNNAGDLAIAANGAFTFPTPVAAGAPYSVTVKTQPGGPAQTCTVANGSGTANANVTNVAVSCVVTILAPKVWQGEAQIEDTGLSQTYGPEIAFDASGNAIAVWAKTDATNTRDDIWANRYTPAGGWQTPQLLESGSGEAIAAHVAVDTNGNAIAVWQQTDATGQHIWANRYSGGAWGAAQKIENETGSAFSPRIAFDAAGNALVVWSQSDGALSRIRVSRFTSGGWGAAVTIDGGVGPAYRPQVAVFPGGSAIAVWLQTDSGFDHIFYNTFNGTGWSSANALDSNNNGRTGAPQIAADANGNAIAVWNQGDGTGVTSIYSGRFSAGSWGPVELMESSVLPNALEPRIAMNPAGNAMAVWIEDLGDQSNAWARLYKIGSGWGVPVQIDSPLGYGASSATVAIDPTGNAIAVWTYLESVYSNRYTAGSAWGIPEELEQQVGRANSPNIAMDANGNAIAIWAHTIGGSKTNVWANVFK